MKYINQNLVSQAQGVSKNNQDKISNCYIKLSKEKNDIATMKAHLKYKS